MTSITPDHDLFQLPPSVPRASPTLAAALQYAAKGWPVIPIAPGKKYPAGIDQWQTKATTDPERIGKAWGEGGKYAQWGIGVATGHPHPDTGLRLFIVDIDNKDGLNGTESWLDAQETHGQAPDTYTVATPTGGQHLYYWAPADIEITNDQGGNLGIGIDVRGAGGQAVAPPTIHPDTGTAYEVELDIDVAEAPTWLLKLLTAKPEPVLERALTPRPPGAPERPGDRFNREANWHDLITATGAILKSGGENPQYIRPGKTAKDGAGASLNFEGRDKLHVFTSNWPGLPPGRYCPFWFYVYTQHQGDDRAATRALAVQYGIEHKTPSGGLVERERSADGEAPATGGPPDIAEGDFWDQRPILAHIRDAALSRLVAPMAVLLCVLARVAHHVPVATRLPAVIGATAPLNVQVCLVGPPGAGKSAALAVADDLLDVLETYTVGMSSGAGLMEAYYGPVDNGTRKERAIVRTAVTFSLDEAAALSKLSDRRGETLPDVLRTAWSGGQLSTANAATERQRNVPAKGYRCVVVMGIQPAVAGPMLSDEAGLVERTLFGSAYLPRGLKAESLPEWPGPLSAPRPTYVKGEPFGLDESIASEIRARHIANADGSDLFGRWEGHGLLNRLKLAALFAVLDARGSITVEDWELAGDLWSISGEVRGWTAAEVQRSEAGKRATVSAAKRSAKIEDDSALEANRYERALSGARRAMIRRAEKGARKRSELTRAVAGKHRQLISAASVVDDLVDEGVLVELPDGTFELAVSA